MSIVAPIGAVVRIILRGRFNSEVVTNNVFHYRVDASSALPPLVSSLERIGDGFWAHIQNELRLATHVNQRYENLNVSILDLATGLASVGIDRSLPTALRDGTEGADSLPPYATYTYRYVRSSTDFRHGYKRFAGVPEGANASGRVAAGVFTTRVGTLAAKLFAPFDTGLYVDLAATTLTDVDTLSNISPILLKSVRNGDPVRPIEWAYPSAVVFSGIGTANSRKFGVGV